MTDEICIPQAAYVAVVNALKAALNEYTHECTGLIASAWWDGLVGVEDVDLDRLTREILNTNGIVGTEGNENPEWVRTVRRIVDALALLGQIPVRTRTERRVISLNCACTSGMCLCDTACDDCIVVPYEDILDPISGVPEWQPVTLNWPKKVPHVHAQ